MLCYTRNIGLFSRSPTAAICLVDPVENQEKCKHSETMWEERKKERRHNSLHSHLYNCYSFIYRAQYLSPESLLDTTSLWMYKEYTVWLTACKAPEGRWAAGGADNKAYRATTLLLMRAGQGAFTAVFL